MSNGLRAMWMRGGTSKGVYLLAEDVPSDPRARDALLLDIMGSPDPRQIDGVGGGDPLTSKVAIVRPSDREGVDVDYLFLQVFVDRALVSDTQNCGNILAGVGPFAIERGLVKAGSDETPVTIYMENTGQIAVARVATPDGVVSYAGDTEIDGVPGSAAAIPIEFRETSGSTCGALFPSGNMSDEVAGAKVTMIDNGMPCVLLSASVFGLDGTEAPADLEAHGELRERLEEIRLAAGPLMNLGDVSEKSVPKMTLVSAPLGGGAITTRTFIPHRCHSSIGVLGAVSVATACVVKGTVAHELADVPAGDVKALRVEHPSGELTVLGAMEGDDLMRAEVIRTARKLMDGTVYPRQFDG